MLAYEDLSYNEALPLRALNAALAGARSFPRLNTPFAWVNFFHPTGFKLASGNYLYQGVFLLEWDHKSTGETGTTFWPNGNFKVVRFRADDQGLIGNFMGHQILLERLNKFTPIRFDDRGNITHFEAKAAYYVVRSLNISFPSNRVHEIYTDDARTYYGYTLKESDGSKHKSISHTVNGVYCSDLVGLEFYASGEARSISCDGAMWNRLKRIKDTYILFAKDGKIIDTRPNDTGPYRDLQE